MEKQGKKYSILFLLLLAILVNLKSILFDCDIDTEYAVAMSYRMLQGDGMFLQMWEPHQTSAFLCTPLMKLFVVLTGKTTGIVVYLQLMGVLIHGLIVWTFYHFMKKRVNGNTARLMSIFFLAVRPKDIVFPEYTNMQIWFSVLLFLSLLYYLEQQEHKGWLWVSGIFLCLEVLAYPSCILVWFAVIAILWVYSRSKGKDIFLFTASCTVFGMGYLSFALIKTGSVKALMEVLQHIVSSDASHQAGSNNMGFFFWENLFVSLIWLIVSMLLGVVCYKVGAALSRRLSKGSVGGSGITPRQERGNILLVSFGFGVAGLVIRLFYMTSRVAYVSLYLLVIGLAIMATKKCGRMERKIFWVGMAISLGSFVATLLLTNLDFSSTLMYLILAVMVSFIPLSVYCRQEARIFKRVVHYDAMILMLLLCLFWRGVTVKTLGGFASPFKIGGIVKSGPELGIFADYMGASIRNTSLAEWEHFVKEGENLLIVEKEGTSTIGYLYNDTCVSTSSTICTPTYDEQLLNYWEQYPEKFPDVVAVQCWYGEPALDDNAWIMQWLEEEFPAVTVEDGTYWRFYRRNIY